MDSFSPVAGGEEGAELQLGEESTRTDILEQLERVAGSSHFRNSKRYPTLLRYIVEETLAGRSDSLKERTLGICVFDRSPTYDTNVDPVVRVSAGEVRKRIAQYYQMPGHEHELKIEIPLGSYIPKFYRPAEVGWTLAGQENGAVEAEEAAEPASDAPFAPATVEPVEETARRPESVPQPTARHSRWWLALGVLGALVAFSIAAFLLYHRPLSTRAQPTPGLATFWARILQSPAPTLIVLGVHSCDAQGNDISPISHASFPQPRQTLLSAMTRSDMIHLNDVTSYGSVVQLLSTFSHSFRTQGAADTTLEQLRDSPFVLIGGFNNIWTKRLTQQLRFRFVTIDNRINLIQDSQHPETVWTLDTSGSALSNSRDYGIASFYLDPETEQYVVLVGGIGMSGTEAASDFLTNGKNVDKWFQSLPPHAGNNVEVVVSTDVIEGKHGPPHVVAAYTW